MSIIGLYSAIGFMFAISLETKISKGERIKIGLLWIITVPILIISKLLISEEEACLNELSLSHSSFLAQTQNEQKLLSENKDSLTYPLPGMLPDAAGQTIGHVQDLTQSPPQDIRLVAQSVVVDPKGVARVVPSVMINK